MIRQDLDKLELPESSGVYFWKDSTGKVLYIGKATSLRDRVKSYFSPDIIKTRGAHIVDMVFKAHTITVQETMNVLEALILEANLIKKYKPYYNTKEKDDKSFNCIVITHEDFPLIFLARQKDINQREKIVKIPRSGRSMKYDLVYGPYPKGSSIKEALRILRRIFPFRDLSSVKKDNATFYRQIGLAPDTSEPEAKSKYKKNIGRLKTILQGKLQTLLKNLKKEMLVLAKKQKFEEATEIKNKIFALEHIQDISLIKRDLANAHEAFRIEAYDVAHISGTNMVGVMVVVENSVSNKNEYRKFIVKGFDKSNDAGALREILTRRLAHTEWKFPNAIVVDGNIIQKNVAEKVLKDLKINIPVIAVTKDERHRPKAITGEKLVIEKYKYEILLANNESHRFAVSFHRQKRKYVML